MLVANDLSAANDLTQREQSQNLDGTDEELDRVLLGVGLHSLDVVCWALESVKTKGLEGLKDGLELGTSRGSKALLEVDLLAELGNNLGPENGLGDKG